MLHYSCQITVKNGDEKQRTRDKYSGLNGEKMCDNPKRNGK